jgi:hypothetical protein
MVLSRVAAPLVSAMLLLVAGLAFAQNTATSKFDHDATGFPLTGTHISVPCASCHINARFKTTPRACFGCHNGMTAPGAASVLSHPITTNYCEGCHQTTTWRDYRFIDHVQALGPCANCHNGKIAVGKTPHHPITNAACNTCHFNTVTFKGGTLPPNMPQTPAATTSKIPAATSNAGSPNRPGETSTDAQTSASMRNAPGKPNHAGFVSGCAACHNGVAATGKKLNHIVTTAPCESCHKSTVTFAGARMNHAGIVANCIRCHNGVVATAKPAKHITTNAPCESCHKSTMSFVGARVDHASLTGACASCHNGVVAEGRPRQHMMTTAPCDTCHRTMFWTPATFRHVSPAFVNHGPAIGCESCHIGNAQTAAWKFPAFRPNCAGCHANQYRPMAHVKFVRPVKIYYTVSELRDCTGACHTYADSTMRTIVTRNFSRHRAFGGGW